MQVTRNSENGKFRFASMTEAEFMEIQEDGGICLGCEAIESPIEPDAARAFCGSCGMPFVYGANQLLLMGRIRFTAPATEEERRIG